MNFSQQPFVSVVTPVHNGAEFLEECITSVIAQTHQHWEYVILNNASTDSTGEIAGRFAKQDERIRVLDTDRLLPIMENWNMSMRKIDSRSVYCKVVHADDYLLPDCLATMVEIADRCPSVGIVGSYAFWGDKIASTGLNREEEVVHGHEICRKTLMKDIYPFQSPSCLLIRSDLIRARHPCYREGNLHADVQMCYELLRNCDFGFAHRILTYVRRHDNSTTSMIAKPSNTILQQNLDLLMEFGPEYLNDAEYSRMLRRQLDKYQRFLRRNLHRRDKAFWDLHSRQLAKCGMHLSRTRLQLLRAITRLSNKLTRRFQM